MAQQISTTDSTNVKSVQGINYTITAIDALNLHYTPDDNNIVIDQKDNIKGQSTVFLPISQKPITNTILNPAIIDDKKTTIELNSIKFALGNYFHTEIETNIVNNNQKNGDRKSVV